MRSYIKIYGPPVLKALKALEKIALSMTTVCIMDHIVPAVPYSASELDTTQSYFQTISEGFDIERCNNIISKSAEKLGEYDFFFEWFKDPSQEEINELIEKIDNALTPLGCKYTITTKSV